MRAGVVGIFLAVLFCTAHCQADLRTSLASRVRAMSGSLPGGYSSYVAGTNTFTFVDAVQIATSDIASKVSETRTYSVGTGAFLGRQLFRSFFRRVGGFFKRAGSLTTRKANRNSRASTIVANRLRAANVPYSSERVSFTPFSDLGTLKFSTSYYKLHHEEKLNSPGLCMYKAAAIVGSRSGNKIQYQVGYGYSFGTGLSQYTSYTHRVCRRRFFSKKCRDETIQVNRGLTPSETQIVFQGLSVTLFSALANKISSDGRLLRRAHKSPTPTKRNHKKHHTFQHARGVEDKDVNSAIASMIGEKAEGFSVTVSKGDSLFINDSQGRTHRVKVNGKHSKNVKVWTLNPLA